MESSNLEVNENSKEIPRTISPDADGKMKSESKEVMKIEDVVVPWEMKADEKCGNAIELDLLSEKPNFDAFYCMFKSEREWNSSLDDNCNSWLTENVPN